MKTIEGNERTASMLRRCKMLTNSEHEVVASVESIRKYNNMTCNQMAKVLGITPSRYSEFKNGKRKLTTRSVLRALAIGIPIGPFIKEYGNL